MRNDKFRNGIQNNDNWFNQLLAVFRRYYVPRCFAAKKKKKLHSVVKENRKFKFQFNMAQEEININNKPTKATKDIKKKKQKC